MTEPMLADLTADQISRVISQATAPTFLLGAVAAFISVLITRINRIVDRSNLLITIADDATNAHLKEALPHLKWRAKLMNKAIEFAIISGIFTILLVILAFISAILNFRHEYGAAALFAVALCFFVAALFTLWREVRAALRDLDQFD
jgi:asparagine N-glycosylation enzyme membrane subunit Stt3